MVRIYRISNVVHQSALRKKTGKREMEKIGITSGSAGQNVESCRCPLSITFLFLFSLSFFRSIFLWFILYSFCLFLVSFFIV